MARYFYSDSVEDFLEKSPEQILGEINAEARTTAEAAQQRAWLTQVEILQIELVSFRGTGSVYFEFSVPRVGKRIDVALVLHGIVFVLEFKVGETSFTRSAVDQVWDYALDLKNFHETSHAAAVAPMLIATRASSQEIGPSFSERNDGVLQPILLAPVQLAYAIQCVLTSIQTSGRTEAAVWEQGRYKPTPTIVEAARALYAGHSVEEISGSGAEAKNLGETTQAVISLVHRAVQDRQKIVCFVTGVPGAGKTLVGLNISNHVFPEAEGKAVYLSGNGPLVKVLQEALAADRHQSLRGTADEVSKGEARRAVTSFIQNVHHFRDAYIEDQTAPHNHISIFDEAQRAWNRAETARFMKEKKGISDFPMSEPEFLLSCMNRHEWAVVVCLVGGGQEINRGEAGITGWIDALVDTFPDWQVYVSPELADSEYAADVALQRLEERGGLEMTSALHLSTSMRSFRASGVSSLIKSLLDLDSEDAKARVLELGDRYPLVITRSIEKAKEWVRKQARGNERFGLMVSSQAQRLKPLAIDVRVATNPVHWFLKGKDDVRSSFYLEDAATEFDVQGLELDWACVVWDGDFRHALGGWTHSSFRGNRWERISKPERQAYLKNAYRVLLTRARQGMVIVVPEGEAQDHTRLPAMYDGTFRYLSGLGLRCI
ncbi:MAG: DUF2075 domain-containing protein [Pseudomonadota bacterium]